MKLYTYFRSSAAYRVRIALNLKGLPYEAVPVHLLRDGGQQNQAAYREKSPLGIVPALQTDTGVLTQSLAIIEWLDETYPQVPLLPAEADGRARVRAIAQTIACDIHPLNNLRVLGYLTKNFGINEEQKNDWYRHWVNDGLAAVEKLLGDDPRTGTFCHGEMPGMTDCCLIPQVFNARRFNCPLEGLPTIQRIVAACESMEAFQNASPARQGDAE
ncbi:MAG: maleylacetoacetate isomerase [Rhodoferax sp.]|uniref:maleylacetoacetate isomerase n=1 Tax=Rhodoferax sp. TaxID=50421 RepID=UPI0017E9E950|nr:maleylacetoacetate isomerase [Rhodoferax sp.]NMM12482.1 maleylacetoacetate isomerase [Rhodoferax sp.]NMM21815.1 maleylacetoacetate isomerase [Rhodoferax sp.]